MKVLIIRFSSIGDIVLTTPVVRCLKKAEGLDAEIHYATKAKYSGLLRENPYVDMVHALDERGIWNLIRRLRSERFDHVIDLHNNQRSLLMKTMLGKRSTSFKKLNIEKWLLTRFKINLLPDSHIVDRYMAAAAPLGVVNDTKGLDYFMSPDHQGMPECIPGPFRKDYIAFGIGGRHATKRLPNEKIMQVCQMLNRPVVLLGGAEDANNGNLIANGCPGKVFNACGLLTLDQTAYMLSMANKAITHDTGMMHIAAAFKKPVISIWGNTIPAFGMSPYMPGHAHLSNMVEVDGLPCRPCSKIGFDKCPKGHFDCMNKIDIGKIVEAANPHNSTAPDL